jgi:3-hydroxybutyryl-CoA dehydratase
VILDTVCTVAGKTVIEGECMMMPAVRAAAPTGTA